MVMYADHKGLDQDVALSFVSIMRAVDTSLRDNDKKRRDSESANKHKQESSSIREMRSVPAPRRKG